MNHQSLRLTPSNSPFFNKSTTPRSPTKPRTEEAGLRLQKVIGTTTAGVNGFDFLPARRQFAYCAGSAVVVATVDADLQVTQRFFRARPIPGGGARDGGGVYPVTPTPNEARSRALGHVRDQPIGGSPLGASARDWSDSPSGKTATAKDRVKAATSVALSPNGKWVALGETGYKPRITLFSSASDSGETPVCTLAEHTFGVQSLRFSPDSRYLASLGTVNDGFLYLWAIDDRTGTASLHSSNKCTVVINDMLWIGRNLLTIGLRFVKVWRPSDEPHNDTRPSDSTASFGTPKAKNADFGNSILSPRQKVLAGKNTLLGDLLDCTFVCAVPLDDDSVIVCAESGEVAIIDDISKTQSFRTVATVDFVVSAARVDSHGLLSVTGGLDELRQFDLSQLRDSAPLQARRGRRSSNSPTKTSAAQRAVVTATCSFGDDVLEIDSRRNIKLARSAINGANLHSPETHYLPAHNDCVSGVQDFDSNVYPDAAFFTFSGNGVFRLWAADGSSISEMMTIPVQSSAEMFDQANELRAAAHLRAPDGEYIVAGDRYGTLTLMNLRLVNVACQVRAHSAEIADVVEIKRQDANLLATCSRDRTVQVFVWLDGHLDLLQTLDEHAAAVNGLLASSNGERLLSFSQDRTVVVREAMLRDEDDPLSIVFVMTRSIALKSSPTSICPAAQEDEILVASMDRCIGQFNVKTGQTGFSFKCSDAEGGEAVSMSKIAYEASLNGSPAIIGVSGSDKSVRTYSEYGSLIARDWGHTEGITGLAVFRLKNSREDDGSARIRVVTAAADSTVFIWNTMPPSINSLDATADTNGTPSSSLLASPTPLRPPLRKVISFSEISRFKREKSGEDGNHSPTFHSRQTSPQRLRKKPSKVSMSQAPKLEPAFRGEHARRRSLRKRSPSPPSPRTRKDPLPSRKPSLGMTLRSKSSENVLDGVTSPTSSTGFGSLTASTESVIRTLRVYRKKIAGPSSLETVPVNLLQDLEAELKLLTEVVGTRGFARRVDDGAMAKVLEEASEKIVHRLDERIKEKVEDELRKSTDAAALTVSATVESKTAEPDVAAVTGAMEDVALREP